MISVDSTKKSAVIDLLESFVVYLKERKKGGFLLERKGEGINILDI